MELMTRWNGCEVRLRRGDITTLAIDAIVNAANKWLHGGGGVDGAIHRRGGQAIYAECQAIIQERGGPLPTGQAVITTGGKLPARHVIHTVGPIYHLDAERDRAAELLASCYQQSLAVLRSHGLRSIAFPCISTGAYGYPSEEACPVVLRAVREDLEQHGQCDQVIFCAFERADYEVYQKLLL
jgi:O-acetyl-ADP-ribose deacetylase (regulator of RNase III)